MKNLYALALVAILFSSNAHAIGSSSGSLFFFSAGAGVSSGTVKGEQLGLASRGMIVYGLGSDLGMRFGGFKVGAGVNYDLWKQLKDPKEFSGTNAQGKELSIAPLLGYDFGVFNINARYFLSSKYSLDKADGNGKDVEFSGPSGSFAVDLRIPFGRSYFGLNYKSMKYDTIKVGETEGDLASGGELKTSSFGLSYGFAF